MLPRRITEFGKVYAYEVNGFGSFNLMDDANVPSLLSLPYLKALPEEGSDLYNTRKLLLSDPTIHSFLKEAPRRASAVLMPA